MRPYASLRTNWTDRRYPNQRFQGTRGVPLFQVTLDQSTKMMLAALDTSQDGTLIPCEFFLHSQYLHDYVAYN